jgi:hypothetical protein
VKKPNIKVLRGILKKPRRPSKEAGSDDPNAISPIQQTVHRSPSIENVAAPAHNTDADDSKPDYDDSESLPEFSTTTGKIDNINTHPLGPQKAALQMPSFDRMLFAIRGAQLRDEYMRQSADPSNNSFVSGSSTGVI